jgi:hypothetical protein
VRTPLDISEAVLQSLVQRDTVYAVVYLAMTVRTYSADPARVIRSPIGDPAGVVGL